MEKLKNILETHGLRPTLQRLTVLEYLERHLYDHPTAENIYETLVKRIPTISITTVYNTLNAFLEKGIIAAETITGTEIRYDFQARPHHHFLCKRCNKIYDIEMECPFGNDNKNIIEGHHIHEVHGYFKGICRICHDKQTTEQKGD